MKEDKWRKNFVEKELSRDCSPAQLCYEGIKNTRIHFIDKSEWMSVLLTHKNAVKISFGYLL